MSTPPRSHVFEDNIPPTVYCFIAKCGKVVSTTVHKGEANGWLEHRKGGESVVEYGVARVETK